MKKNIIIVVTLYILLKIFIEYKLVLININSISVLFFKNIFPPLFIFFIISSILINYGFANIISNIFGKTFNKLFRINKYSSYILFMSMISGLPSNAKYIKELLEKKLINHEDASKILLFTHFANPLFILSLVKVKPYLVLLAHYIPNFIIGLLFRNYYPSNYQNNTIKSKNTKNIITILTESITNSFNILLSVFGLIIIFYTLSSLTNSNILKYILEMSSSIININNFNLPLKYKTLLITGILSFGGICIHMQVFSILEKEKIRYAPYLLSRLIHFILSTLIIYCFY